jgi:multiple sugar transport system permease protein
VSTHESALGPTPSVNGLLRNKGRALGKVLLYLALIVLSGLFLIPFFWLVTTSLKTQAQIFGSGWIPRPIQWSNYADVFANTDFLLWTRNSFIVAILGMVTVAYSSALIAYPFAKMRFPLKNVLFALVMATMMLPGAVTMVPTFLIWRGLGLVNTLWPLWAGNLFGSAFYIFMLRQFLLTIPNDLRDAAMVDGASHFRTFWSVMLPLVKPALIAVMLFEFIAKWNDYMTPLIYLNQGSLYTLPLGLATFLQSQGFQTRWDLWMAGSVLMTLPILILFFAGQRFFIAGIATTGLKG